jgi:serine/threonine-protein kinase RsbW
MKKHSDALVVAGNLESIAAIRSWLEAFLRGCSVPDATVTDIQAAVTELCTNVVKHGYQAESAGEIKLEVVFRSGTIEITITDSAPAFVPEPEALLPEQRLAEGGYGTFMIQSLMDQVTYESLGETGNRTTLVKRVATTLEDEQNSEEQADTGG